MRRIVVLAALAAVGCDGMYDSREEEMRMRGLTPADLESGPDDTDIRTRIMGDVREWWLPAADLHKGSPTCDAIRWERGDRPLCALCAELPPMKVILLRADAPDRQHPVRETAYFCPAESRYWYRYEGGPLKREVWLGPRFVRLRAPKGVPQDP